MKTRLLFFDTMITPKLITFIYWLMLLGAVFFGLSHMFGGYGGFTFSKFIRGLVFIVGGVLAARIWCELLIVIFKINENLQNLKKMIRKLLLVGFAITLVLSSCKKREVRKEWIDNHLVQQFYVVETDNGSFVRDGEYKTWFRSGQIERNGKYENGRQEGNWKGWYINGQLEFDYNYENDTLVGSFLKWFENGQKSIEGIKINNAPATETGGWTSWYKNGQVASKNIYDSEGNLDGTQTYWHSNGKKSKEAIYVNGIKEGTYKTWDFGGRLSLDRIFKKGMDVDLPCVYNTNLNIKCRI